MTGPNRLLLSSPASKYEEEVWAQENTVMWSGERPNMLCSLFPNRGAHKGG